MKNILLISLFLISTNVFPKNLKKVIFGGTENSLFQIFKDKKSGHGINQEMTKMLLEGSGFEPHWEEMSNLRQQKELSKPYLFCRIEKITKDNFNTKRTLSEIEKYVNEDIKEFKHKFIQSIPFRVFYRKGYIAIRKDKIQKFKEYFLDSAGEYPIIDGKKLTNQKDLTTGWIPGSNGIPPLMVTAANEKRIIRLETIMDYDINFYRMVESNRIDFYIDTHRYFKPSNKLYNSKIIKDYPELKNLISLEVPDFDLYGMDVYECSATAKNLIKIINEKLLSLSKTKEEYRRFIEKSLFYSRDDQEVFRLWVKFYVDNYNKLRELQAN